MLREMRAEWPFFASLVNTIEMALFKTDLGVAAGYLRLVDPDAARPALGADLRRAAPAARPPARDHGRGAPARVHARAARAPLAPQPLGRPAQPPPGRAALARARGRRARPRGAARDDLGDRGGPAQHGLSARFTSGRRLRRLARMAERDLDRLRDERPRRAETPAPEVGARPCAAGHAADGGQSGRAAHDRRLLMGGKDVLPEAVADPEENFVEQGGRAHGRAPRSSANARRRGRAPLPAAAPNLKKKNVSGPTSEKHGGFKWVVQWELDKPSPAGGVIIQKVNAVHDIKDKDGKKLGDGLRQVGALLGGVGDQQGPEGHDLRGDGRPRGRHVLQGLRRRTAARAPSRRRARPRSTRAPSCRRA